MCCLHISGIILETMVACGEVAGRLCCIPFCVSLNCVPYILPIQKIKYFLNTVAGHSLLIWYFSLIYLTTYMFLGGCPHLVVHRTYSWLCNSGITLGGVQGIIYGVKD